MNKDNGVHQHIRDKSVAIIGMSCRFPGGANSPDDFWRILVDQENVISEVPVQRWDKNAYQAYPYGAFIDDIDLFDASFFRIGEAEANAMDPQQRLLLEVTWHALEDANINPDTLRETKVGIFVGQFSHDYQELQRKSVAAPEELSVHYATGTFSAVSAGRIAYFLGTTGPTLTIDTACSSSLVAIHQAVYALRQGLCELAIVGGVNAILSPELQVNFSKAGMLSPDGKVKTFDDQANGYVRGEGCGVVILRLQNKAIEAQNRIKAIIRGVAINQDGASNGLTAPNGLAQEEVIKMALLDANLEPDCVDYIEAHGTGTALGDPIELNALQNVYCSHRQANHPINIGSAKPNIGHLEAAAGMAGMFKIVLSLKYKKIPRQLNFDTINKNICLSSTAKIVDQDMPWLKKSSKVRFAAQSSFGFSGTNVHIIIEEASENFTITTENEDIKFKNKNYLLVFSARDKETLNILKNRYVEYLENQIKFDEEFKFNAISMADITCTAAVCRKHFNERLAIFADSKKKLLENIKISIANDLFKITTLTEAEGFVSSPANKLSKCKVMYVAVDLPLEDIKQLLNLYVHCQEYADMVDSSLTTLDYGASEIFSSFLESSGDVPNQVFYRDLSCFILQYALARYWLNFGVKFDGFAASGIGQLVASVIAKVMTLKEVAGLLESNALIKSKLKSDDIFMMDVFLEASMVNKFLVEIDLPCKTHKAITLDILSINSVRVVSCSKIIYALHEFFLKKDITVKIHAREDSEAIQYCIDSFKSVIREINYQAPMLPLIVESNVKKMDFFNENFWMNSVFENSFFSNERFNFKNINVLLFLGSKQSFNKEILFEKIVVNSNFYIYTLCSKRGGLDSIFLALGVLYTLGIDLNWSVLTSFYLWQEVDLPKYPFKKKRYWLEVPLPVSK